MSGNHQKFREALDDIVKYLAPIRKWTMPSKERKTRLTALFATVDTVYQKATAALAAPPRNCDVGSAAEQSDRLNLYCDEHGRYCDGSPKCNDCPLLEQVMTNGGKCELMWAQMPYKEGGEK